MKIKGILLKAGSALPPDVIDVEDDIDINDLYKLLNCNAIDTTYRYFGQKRFLIICDDEGWLKEKPIATAYEKRFLKLCPVLAGNLLILGDVKGELPTSLGLRDIVCILDHGFKKRCPNTGKKHYALLLDD